MKTEGKYRQTLLDPRSQDPKLPDESLPNVEKRWRSRTGRPRDHHGQPFPEGRQLRTVLLQSL